MSIIIIAFPAAPKVDPEAVRKEDELNKLIKQKVTGKMWTNWWFLAERGYWDKDDRVGKQLIDSETSKNA